MLIILYNVVAHECKIEKKQKVSRGYTYRFIIANEAD